MVLSYQLQLNHDTVLSLIFILFVDDDAYVIYSEAWQIPISSMLKIVGYS